MSTSASDISPSTFPVQPMSKIVDTNFDDASIIHESSLLSRYCAEKAEMSASTDCFKLCRIHSDVTELAAKLLMSVGTDHLHSKHYAPGTSTTTTTSNTGEYLGSIMQNADQHTKSLDIAGLLALAMETARRVRTVCSMNTGHDHCQSCAQGAGRVETVIHGLLTTKKGMEHNKPERSNTEQHTGKHPATRSHPQPKMGTTSTTAASSEITNEGSEPGSVVSPLGVLPNKEPSKGQDQGLPKKLSEMGADAPRLQPGPTTAVSQEEGTKTHLHEE